MHPGSPTKEELEELAARSNAVIEKGLHQLEEEQGGRETRAGRQAAGPPPLPSKACRRRHFVRGHAACMCPLLCCKALPCFFAFDTPDSSIFQVPSRWGRLHRWPLSVRLETQMASRTPAPGARWVVGMGEQRKFVSALQMRAALIALACLPCFACLLG